MRTFFNFIFTNNPARISPKEISGASGGFLPKPLLLRLRHPNSKKISRVFCEILSPKNSYRKTESALVPPPAQKLLGQNTKEKCPFLFRKNRSRANPKSKEHFSLVSAEALRGGGGADSFVQFPLEKGSRKVYDYSTQKQNPVILAGFCFKSSAYNFCCGASINFLLIFHIPHPTKNPKAIPPRISAG